MGESGKTWKSGRDVSVRKMSVSGGVSGRRNRVRKEE